MSAPNSRSRSPASPRKAPGQRGGARARLLAGAVSTWDNNDAGSLERSAAPKFKETTRGNRGYARDNSTGGTARTHHRGMVTRSTRPPERDRFLETVSSLRDLVLHYGRTATWMFTLASAFACASFQLPLPTDNLLTRGLLFLAAVGVGALMGKRLDRAKRFGRAKRRGSRSYRR